MTTTDRVSESDVTRSVELSIGGMTCASCALRVEKKLNALEGVSATVNYATEKANVTFAPQVAQDELIAAVQATGYTAAAVPGAPEPAVQGSAAPGSADAAGWLRRWWVSTALAVPVMVLSMIPALQFTNWQWLALMLATPVVMWGAWPFHRAAWTNLRHGAATMDTLISVGVGAAYMWSLYALFLGGAGEPGMRMRFSLLPVAGGTQHIYLETAAAVTAFILAGRYFEARAKGKSGAAFRAA